MPQRDSLRSQKNPGNAALAADAEPNPAIAAAVAYGWTDYTPEMANEEILRRLLALNRARAEAR